MTTDQSAALDYALAHSDAAISDLMEWVTIPSISSLPEYSADMQRAAEWAAARLRRAGLQQVRIMPTAGHPLVYGEWLHAGPGAPVVLLYGHYDVQPALDLSAWSSLPFEPQVRGEALYGRGASDMKGQTIAEIAAVEAILQTAGQLPVNVKFMIEGEEEIGSRHLRAFIQENRELLACDYALNPDAGMAGLDQPSVTYGLRGGARLDLIVSGPRADVHSGTFGGTLHNPAQALIELIAGLHDADGRVQLPGFYDRVRPLSEEERRELARVPMDTGFFLDQTGVPALWGEPEYTPYERTCARPTLEVLAMHAGLPGEGALNIVPARATAALSMRLVPDQDPQEVVQALLDYLAANAPAGVRWELRRSAAGRGILVDRDLPGVKALQRALEATWGKQPLFMRIGGGIPVVSQLQEELGIPSVLSGFGLPTDNIHGPDEHLHLPTWRLGVQSLVRFFFEAVTTRSVI